ncbi:MAG: ComEC/Rec2 family competence protein [Clostridia bacterium]|nr:ComEC/Rec2 family competence protein [Clostridia bacterium]
MKLFNFRPLVGAALSLIFGIICAYLYPKFGIYSLVICFAAFAAILFLSKFIFKNVPFVKRACVVAVFLSFALVGYGRFCISALSVQAGVTESRFCRVEGRIASVSVNEGRKTVTLSDCRYDGKRGGDLIIYDFSGYASVSDLIATDCEVSAIDFFDGEMYDYELIRGLSMRANGNSSLAVTGRDKSLSVMAKDGLKQILTSVDDEMSGVAVALMTGDTSEMDEDLLGYFRLSGVAHIFAVSGMHVGLIYCALYFIAGIFGNERILKTLLVSLCLVFYAAICGFSPSALRATVMCVSSMVVTAVGEKRDRLNGLALACIVVCMIDPFDLFGVGFALSFVCALSVITIAPPVARSLDFLPSKISRTLSAIIAIQAATLPLLISYFGYYPAISIISNIFLLPAVTVTFYALWIGVLTAALMPFNRLIGLFIPFNLLRGCGAAASFAATSGVYLEYFPDGIKYVYYPVLFGVSDLFSSSARFKYSCAIALTAILLFLVLFPYIFPITL